MDKLHEEIISTIEAELPALQSMAKKMYENPEIGGKVIVFGTPGEENI